MSIPEIRSALQYIDSYASVALKKSDDMRAAAVDFAKEWHAVFQKKLSIDDALEYMKHVASLNTGKKGQKGGMAELDYTMRAGTIAPYGVFLPYVSKGFDVGVPEMSETALCAAGGTPALIPYPDTGSNLMKGGSKGKKQTGAGFMDTLKQVWSHPPASAPPSVVSDAISTWRGQPIGPGGDSTTRAYTYIAPQSASNFSDLYKSGVVKSL